MRINLTDNNIGQPDAGTFWRKDVATLFTIADKTMVGAQCGVISDTKGNGENLIGSPAMNPKEFFKAKALYRRLPDMYKEIGALRKELEELKKQHNA